MSPAAGVTPEASRAAAARIVQVLRDGGHEAWFVGGCVREALLGNDPSDHDVTTDATPDRMQELFPRTVPVGARFGVVLVVEAGIPIEVATFRTEGGYADGRRPDHVRFATAREDVLRRDFTVNALLQDPFSGEVIDHVGGRGDLLAGVLRTVGDPLERFAEDHLRLLRAARFAARLGFRLDASCAAAVRTLAARVTGVAAERVREELSRMLVHRTRGAALRQLDDLGLLAHVLPEVEALRGVEQPAQWHPEGDVLIHTRLALEALPDVVTESVAWATLLHDIGKPACFVRAPDRIRFHGHETVGARAADGVLRRLKASNELRERVVVLIEKHLLLKQSKEMRRSTLRRVLAEPWFDELLVLCRADSTAGSGDVSHLDHVEQVRTALGAEPPVPPALVTGADLRAAGLPPGPAYARLLRRLADEQIEGLFATREQALARLAGLAEEEREPPA